MSWRTERGQASVEAAFLIPVLFAVLMLLIQPGIILYDRMVMNYAAADGCRLLATSTTESGLDQDKCKDLIRRHLGAIPQHDLFHRHGGSCTYRIETQGDDSAGQVSVRISNELRLLPLFANIGSALGAAPGGYIDIQVEQHASTRPHWLEGNSADPGTWVHERD